MPCDSRIVTKLTDGVRIADALRAHGYAVETVATGNRVIGTKGRDEIMFERRREADAFAVFGDRMDFTSIARKYAEIGVQTWAKRRGYGITENDGRQMVLVNRRG
jgi:hypothetical protein